MAVMMGTTAGLSVLLVWLALRARSVANGVLWCALGGIAAGVLNAGVALGGIELVRRGDPGALIGGFFLGTLFGGIYGGPLGLLFGTGYSVVAGSALRARLDPSHDGPDTVLLTAGSWLALGGALLAQVPGAVPHVLSPVWLIAGGAAIAGVAAARRWARWRWLDRVAAGRDHAWRIEPRRGVGEEAGLVPVLRAFGPSPEGVVTRCAPTKDPYRSAMVAAPVALAALPAPMASAGEGAGGLSR
jgi:hypothetical protein